MDNTVIGERIKRLRLERNMTREKLAEEAELSVSFLYEIETGKKSFSAYTLGNLAKALDVNMDYIVYGKMEPEAGKNPLQIQKVLTRENLLYIQQMLLKAYNEIQELLDY